METQPVTDASLARWAQVSFFSLLGLILVKIVLVWAAPDLDVRLSYIALLAALPVLVFSRKRLSVARGIDWSTLVFFAAMFVLMAAVWNSGAVQSFVDSSGVDLASAAVLFPASIIVSQFVSNVPLVAMYLPILEQSGAGLKELLILAAGSTIAGNLTILGPRAT
jgi:Na+/H+ antiporter NhaD/arsenite permease-like protein